MIGWEIDWERKRKEMNEKEVEIRIKRRKEL